MTKALLRLSLALLALALTPPALSAPLPTAATDAARAGALKNRRKVRALLRRKGLSKLPGVDGALAGRTRRHVRHAAAAVTGTPPTLGSIPGQPIASLFWEPGVLDAIANGVASPEQCGQFFAGTHDGDSGGMGACHMAEGVGYSFSNILGDNSLCYMKNVPTPANVASGGFTLTSGEFPDGDVTRLFSVPAGANPRTVRVAVSGQGNGGQNVFLRVASEEENTAAGNLYGVDLWFCKAGDSAPASGFERIRISNAGELTSEDQESDDGGSNVSTITGFVSFQNGTLVYDTARSRHVVIGSQHGDGSFKADHTVAADNTISSKTYDTFGGSGGNKSYVVASFSGSGADSLRFLAGAFKERHTGGPSSDDVRGSTEFRDTFYAASPGNPLESRLDAVDLGSDPFYASPPSVTVDASAYSCSTAPDVAVTLDFANPAIAPLQALCEHREFQNMHFCHDDPAVQAAEQHYGPACGGPH